MSDRHWRKCNDTYKLTEKGGRLLARVARMADCGRWCLWLLDSEYPESPMFEYLWEAKANAEIKLGKTTRTRH